MSGGMQGGGGVPETLLDTKGQLHGFSDENVAVDVGTNDFTVYADSSATPGISYGASAKSLLDATGKILYASAANTLAAVTPGAENTVLTMGGSSVPSWAAAAGGGSLELIEAHTFDGSETSHAFTTDINFNTTYSDMIVVFHGLTASSTTMSLRTNGRTINYYSYSRKNGTATTSSNVTEAFVMDGMGGTYANICIIHCITAAKPAGTFMGSNDVGQNVITGGFGNTNNNTDAGILTEFELLFDNAPTSTAQAVQYGVKRT